jgi:hypothetical protein
MSFASQPNLIDHFDILDNSDVPVLRPRRESSALIYVPGLSHIATCKSQISHIDGSNGIFIYVRCWWDLRVQGTAA